ncbi:MAG: hypothetical protein L0Z53_25885 [Acidobacteriales bacterium]|nr:hypothetical protein [Terriglobales bacterium]
MAIDPLSLALHEITETKRLLETLITSSESFDYPKAKVTLKHLERKVRELGKLRKLQYQLQTKRISERDPKIHALDFAKSPVV